VRQLRKPTVAAWLANMLVRERPREVGRLIELGSALRDAQARFDAQALRYLSEQRHDLVGALSGDARHLAGSSGQRVSDAVVGELEATLEAAFFDQAAADELRRGRLAGALSYSGIGFPLSSAGPPSPSPRGDGRSGGSRRPPEASRETEERPEREDRSAARAAQHDARDARQAASRAGAALSAAERDVERKEAELSAAEEEVARRRALVRSARQAAARARADRDAAERAARRAEERAAEMARSTAARSSRG
jgi:hypothetical protein